MRRVFPFCALKFIIPFGALLISASFIAPILAQDTSASEKVKQANALSIIALEKAAKARETCNCGLQKEALEFAYEAAVLLSEAAAEAEKAGDLALTQDVYNIATNMLDQAIYLVTEVCTYCIQTSFSPETVACFEENCPKAGEIAEVNNATKEAAVAAGAIPTEPPAPYIPPETAPGFEGEPEIPIRDHEQPPASPI
jgi:hypothetical protein